MTVAVPRSDIPSDVVTAVQEELADLWADLDAAVREALNGSWSIGCQNIADRIMRLTPLVGPTPWGQVQVPLLLSGTYQRLTSAMGCRVEVSMDEVHRVARAAGISIP
jgi:hypothetical protein